MLVCISARNLHGQADKYRRVVTHGNDLSPNSPGLGSEGGWAAGTASVQHTQGAPAPTSTVPGSALAGNGSAGGNGLLRITFYLSEPTRISARVANVP